MSINFLQAFSPATAVAASLAEKKNLNFASSFDTLLSSLQGVKEGTASTGPQAAAELIRVEMMLNSLSLSGNDSASQLSGMPALESLLAGTGDYCRASHVASTGSGTLAASVPIPADVPPATAAEAEADEIETIAANFLGTPYRFGGESETGIDCSSFVQQVFREHEIDLPRTAREQIKVGTEVAQGDLRKGDLVFFQTYARFPSHVGIYLGEGKMIHASSGKGEVTVSDMNSDYYRSRFLGAKRVA